MKRFALIFGTGLLLAACGDKTPPEQRALQNLMKEDVQFSLLKQYDPLQYDAMMAHLTSRPKLPENRDQLADMTAPFFEDALFVRFPYADIEDLHELLDIEREQMAVFARKDPLLCTKTQYGEDLGYLDDLFSEELVAREEALLKRLLAIKREGTPNMMPQADAERIFSGISTRIFQKHMSDESYDSEHAATCGAFIDLYSTLIDMDMEAAAPMIRTVLIIQ